VRVPKRFEEKLQKIIVTLRLHGIHHLVQEEEMNSNWSSGLSVWDVMHKTFRNDVSQEKITIGIENYDEDTKVTLDKMLNASLVEN
jgi:sterol desaturase/sphingolipid hydroxylase (fatty acid hydroxylase superfamily)